MLRNASCAVRLKTGALAPPVMPADAANDTGARNSVAAIISARNSCVLNVAFFIFFGLIAALLVAGVSKRAAGSCCHPRWDDAVADVNLGHHSTEIFGIVGQVVELGSVDVERAARRIELGGA